MLTSSAEAPRIVMIGSSVLPMHHLGLVDSTDGRNGSLLAYEGLVTSISSPEAGMKLLSIKRPVGCSYLSPLGRVMAILDDMIF